MIAQVHHIKTLTDEQINALLDVYLFGNPVWCSGSLVGHYPAIVNAPMLYKCSQCRAAVDYTLSQKLSGEGMHKRIAPIYRIEEIGARMQVYPYQIQMRFALAIRVGMNTAAMHLSFTSELLHLLTRLTPRLLAIAALNAVEVIDAEGYLKVEAVS